MFEVGGNTCNNVFQLATQQCCVVSCSNLLLLHMVFTINRFSDLPVFNLQIFTKSQRLCQIRVLKFSISSEKPRVREFFQTGALDNTIYECEDIQFICQSFESKLPVIMYNVYHNGTLINGNRTGSFTIRQVRLKDQGQYSCVPKNEVEARLRSNSLVR